MTTHPRNLFFKLGIFGTIQFLILVHLAMWFYAGGTLHEAGAEGYSFTHNFFSDLGRTHTFSGARNVPTSQIFRFTMSVVGICFVAFFFALPGLFRSPLSKGLGIAAAVFGVLAGLCYFGIAHVPYNVDYWGHRQLVERGFIVFLLMTFFYALAILFEKNYPNRYAYALGVFALILVIQIAVMFLGPRSWRSNEALYLQAIAQKIVVYAEVLCMLYQAYGALWVSRQMPVGSKQ